MFNDLKFDIYILKSNQSNKNIKEEKWVGQKIFFCEF